MHQKLAVVALACVLSFPAAGQSQPLPADPVDAIVRTEMEKQHIPGLALAVLKDGRVVRSAGYGVASLELNVPVTTKTVFKIGSVSKQFLASGAMILVQDGKLKLDDGVRKHLEDAPETWSGVTLRHLLSHTSGIVREGPAFDGARIQPDIDVIRSAYPLPLLFPTGEKWLYANVPYFSIAEILARVSGEPWPEFMNRRVFQPLDMKATRTTTPSGIVPNRADGYEWRDGGFRRALEYQALRPSGAFLSTVEDLARWDAALYTETPLTRASREEMWKPVPLRDGSSSGYGLGWEIDTRGGKRVVHHGGTLTGFKSYFARFPDQQLSVVVLTNLNQAVPDRILWQIAAVWLPGVERNDRRPGSN